MTTAKTLQGAAVVAVLRGERRNRGWRRSLATVGSTVANCCGADGDDPEQPSMTLGRFGVGWWHDDEAVAAWASEQVPPDMVADVTEHVRTCHPPVGRGWEATVCETATCEQAQRWAVRFARERRSAG